MRLNGNPAHPWVSILLYIGSMLLLFEWIIHIEICNGHGLRSCVLSIRRLLFFVDGGRYAGMGSFTA